MTDDPAVDWMRRHLSDHREILERSGHEHYSEQVEGLDVTRQIVDHVLPGEPFDIDPARDETWQFDAITKISRAIGVLENRSQIIAYLGPQGPAMPAQNLHPVVWGAASQLWEIEHYRDAVGRAATFLNAHIQDRSTRTDLSDKNLMSQVFSERPASEGDPKLRWSGSGTKQTTQSMRTGLGPYAQGVSQTIRNPARHEASELPRQVALEQLAALSLLARWVDECTLVRTDSS